MDIVSGGAAIISGKEIAANIRAGLKAEVKKMAERHGVTPGLAVVLVGDNPASKIYVRNKGKACEEVGIRSFQRLLPAETKEEDLLKLIDGLNKAKDVHGILVQLPLPFHISESKVIEAISPGKDVDGFHPYNLGRLVVGAPLLQPCTPFGITKMLDAASIDVSGKEAVIVGRSNIVGKPMALMLLKRNATVTVCHSRTRNIEEKIKRGDIVVAALGKPEFVKGEWIKSGAVVIDVGMNRLPGGKLVGDVDFAGAARRASWITPVPGGVGPMTIAMLLHNTVEAAGSGLGA